MGRKDSMKKDRQPDAPPGQKKKELLNVILISLLWVVLLVLSFISYYAIPAVVLISWVIIAWLIKAFKGDKGGGSGYDREF
jgi:thiamine transporter ThiT